MTPKKVIEPTRLELWEEVDGPRWYWIWKAGDKVAHPVLMVKKTAIRLIKDGYKVKERRMA